MSSPSFKHRNLPESLADHLVTMIATHEFSPGQRLFENDLCEQLGVSRIPIREALRILQAQGVVRTEPNRGTFIAELGFQEMLEMLEVRLVVEKAALRRMLALAKLNPSIFDTLQVHIEAMHRAAQASDRLAYSKADLAFHNSIIEASQSPMLKPIWDSLSRDVFVFLVQEREKGYDFKRSARDHEGLLEILRTHDVERIEQEIERHIWSTTRAKLTQSQVPTPGRKTASSRAKSARTR